MPADYVVDIEWPLSGMEVNRSFSVSVKVRNEDDLPGGPAGNHYVLCTIVKGGANQDTGRSADFDPDSEPLLSIPLNAPSDSKHRLIAELFPSTAGSTSIASDEESEIKILAAAPADQRPVEVSISEFMEP